MRRIALLNGSEWKLCDGGPDLGGRWTRCHSRSVSILSELGDEFIYMGLRKILYP